MRSSMVRRSRRNSAPETEPCSHDQHGAVQGSGNDVLMAATMLPRTILECNGKHALLLGGEEPLLL
jgi:hypothetical protein